MLPATNHGSLLLTTGNMGQSPPLTIHLYSFGYRYSGPPDDVSGHGGGFVFDCRALPNPFWEEELRPHHGWEPPVTAFFQEHAIVAEFYRHAAWLVLNATREYTKRGYERLMVSFGCTGGRHRSVYLSELLRRELVEKGWRAELTHIDRERTHSGGEGP